MKKHLSKLFCLVLVLNLVASAAPGESPNLSLTITYGDLKGMLSEAADIVTDLEAGDRVIAYNFGRSNIEEDGGINTLIDLIKDGTFESLPGLGAVEGLASYLEEHKSEAIFLLSFIKSIPESERISAFSLISERKPFSETPSNSLDAFSSNALNATYELYFNEEFREALEVDHEITADILFNLIACLKNKFTVTDKQSDIKKIALKSNTVNSAFKSALETNLEDHFTKVNGKDVSKGEEVLASIIDLLNGAGDNQVANFKKLFEALGMYEKYEPTPTPTPTPTPRRSGGGGGGSSLPMIPAVPAPAVIPAPAVSSETVATVEEFNDITVTHWSAPYVSALVSRNIFKGYEDSSFKPQQGITREELAVVLVRTLGLEARLDAVEGVSFADMDEFGDWSEKSVALLAEMQILQGYEDGTFKPKSIISRQELAVILARAIAKEAGDVSLDFADKDSVAPWAVDAIRKVYALGIIKGYDDKTFQPDNSVSREEVATMLYNFMHTENLL